MESLCEVSRLSGAKGINEAFSENFEYLVRAILRQSKFLISAKNYPIDFWMVLNESWEHATFHDTITQNYQGVLFAPRHTYIHHYCKSLTNYVFTSSYVGSIDLVCVWGGGGGLFMSMLAQRLMNCGVQTHNWTHNYKLGCQTSRLSSQIHLNKFHSITFRVGSRLRFSVCK